MGEWPRQTVAQLLASLADRHSVFAVNSAVVICGWMSGHVVHPIAFCETPEYAELLARGLKSLVTVPAVPGSPTAERSADGPSQDGGSAGPRAVTTTDESGGA